MKDPLPRRLNRQDPDAFEECYRQLVPGVRAYLRRYVPHEDLEDVVQATFADVWASAARYDPDRSLSGWVFTIARRRAIDLLRKRHKEAAPVDTFIDAAGEDGETAADMFAWAMDIRQALRHLPEEQRRTLELAYFEGLTQREIAAAMQTPLGTVKTRASRALKSLRTLLGLPGEEPS